MGAGDTLKAQKRLLSLIDASELQLQKYEHIVKQLDPAVHDEFYLKKRLSMLEVLMKSCQAHVEKLLELLMDDKIQWNEILEARSSSMNATHESLPHLNGSLPNTNPSSPRKNVTTRHR